MLTKETFTQQENENNSPPQIPMHRIRAGSKYSVPYAQGFFKRTSRVSDIFNNEEYCQHVNNLDGFDLGSPNLSIKHLFSYYLSQVSDGLYCSVKLS